MSLPERRVYISKSLYKKLYTVELDCRLIFEGRMISVPRIRLYLTRRRDSRAADFAEY